MIRRTRRLAAWCSARREMQRCVAHNKRFATMQCAAQPSCPLGCNQKPRLRRCKTCQWNDHSLRFTPCIHRFLVATGMANQVRQATGPVENSDSGLTSILLKTLDTLDEAVLVTDVAHRILFVNAAFTRWTGYTTADLQYKTPAFLRSGAIAQSVRDTMQHVLQQQKTWQGEFTNRRKNGDIYLDHVSIVALTDPQGSITHYVGKYLDGSPHKQQEKKLHRMAMYDELTDLPNRRLLQSHLSQAMIRCQRHDKAMAVCMLDLDGFKPVNDTYGHEIGDYVLITLSRRIPEHLRKSDMVARLGGDEFVLLIEDLCGINDLIPLLEKIHAAITAPILLPSGDEIQVGTSMGIYLYPYGDADISDQLLRCADHALYESKSHKNNRDRFWALFGEKLLPISSQNTQRLLENGHLDINYQPIIASKTELVVGIEALARLKDENGRTLDPNQFLPNLDTKNLCDISTLLLGQALQDLKRLDERHPDTKLWLSFNVNPACLTPLFITALSNIITANGIAPERISLEILKRHDFLENNATLSLLQQIKELGVKLTLDDIDNSDGRALRLNEFPIDTIKLDENFVRHLERRPQDLHFVRAIQNLAMDLKVDLIVEGIETPTILDAMQTTGIPFLQGYAISRPLNFSELDRFLDTYQPVTAELPQTLFGYYAGTMASHNSIKKMFMINPAELDTQSLGDSRQCRGYGVQERLGHGEGTLMAQLHHDYHHAIGIAAQHASDHFRNQYWDLVEEKLQLFLQLMLEEWEKTKPEH